MPTINLTTFKDLIDHTVAYMGDNVSRDAVRDAKRAILDGLRELSHAHRWSYYLTRGRMVTAAPYATGTVAYDHTGGASERLVTLTGGTWPDWAAYGQLVLGETVYQVSSRLGATTLQLALASNPQADVAAGASYTLYRDGYPFPADFLAAEEVINTSHCLRLSYENPRVWLSRQRILHSPAAPHLYSIMGDPHYYGALGCFFFPPPDQQYMIDYVYHRRPRALFYDAVADGTVSIPLGSSTVTGSGTSFTSKHIGTVLRVGTATESPTGISGGSPYRLERTVVAVASATSLTVDAASDEPDITGAKYVLSDPVDIEEGAMLTALLRCVEKQNCLTRIMKNAEVARAAYQEALILAREADARSFVRRSPGAGGEVYRLRDFPSGPDVP